MKTAFVVLIIVPILFLNGCWATYTISSNDLLNTGKRIILEGELGFRSSKLSITNPYYSADSLTLVIDGNPVIIRSRHVINMDVPVNLLADGRYLKIPVSVIPPSDNFRSVTRDWVVSSYSSNESWVIQIDSGGNISLQSGSW